MSLDQTLVADKVGIIHFELRNAAGEVLETTEGSEAFAYLHGTGSLPVGMEKALDGKQHGDHIDVTLPAAEAFGELSGQEPLKVKRKELPKDRDYEPGEALHVELEDGTHTVLYVTEAKGAWVTLTMDHPLAGQDLQFIADVVDVREATPSEKQHGHAHGHAGHDHHH